MMKLIYANSPEEYFEMFTCKTGSCMEIGSQYGNGHLGNPASILLDEGIFCGEWYHWNPHSQGVYLKRSDGEIVARAILLRQDSTKDFEHYYADVMGIETTYIQYLRFLLSEKGLKPWAGMQMTISEKFHVRAVECHGKLYMPLPFHDPFNTEYYIAWDDNVQMFECGPLNKEPVDRPTVKNHITYDYRGMFPLTRVLG